MTSYFRSSERTFGMNCNINQHSTLFSAIFRGRQQQTCFPEKRSTLKVNSPAIARCLGTRMFSAKIQIIGVRRSPQRNSEFPCSVSVFARQPDGIGICVLRVRLLRYYCPCGGCVLSGKWVESREGGNCKPHV